LVTDVRRQLDTVPGGTPAVVATLAEHLSRTAVASERVAAVLVGACAATALTLAILGLYGALGDAVRHRRRDIALRLALGARPWRVSWQLMLEGVRLASVGTSAGMIGALAVTRWMAANSAGTGHLEPWVWLAAPGVLFAAVAIASVLPMRRAITVNPVSLLQRN
jgi:putative ABC transport system permease protein